MTYNHVLCRFVKPLRYIRTNKDNRLAVPVQGVSCAFSASIRKRLGLYFKVAPVNPCHKSVNQRSWLGRKANFPDFTSSFWQQQKTVSTRHHVGPIRSAAVAPHCVRAYGRTATPQHTPAPRARGALRIRVLHMRQLGVGALSIRAPVSRHVSRPPSADTTAMGYARHVFCKLDFPLSRLDLRDTC